MRKSWLASLLAALFAYLIPSTGVMALELRQGVDYQRIAQSEEKNEVIEFFSFYCPHCRDFELRDNLPHAFKEALPQGVKFKQYHVNFLGGLSKELTKAWAVAMLLGKEEAVKKDLYLKVRQFKNANDIKQVFIDNGIDSATYDSALQSVHVARLVSLQEKLAKDLKINGVPTVVVNQQFSVLGSAFHNLSLSEYKSKYIDIVKALLEK